MKTPFATLVLFLFLTIATVSSVRDANACTCITLEASDGAVVVPAEVSASFPGV